MIFIYFFHLDAYEKSYSHLDIATCHIFIRKSFYLYIYFSKKREDSENADKKATQLNDLPDMDFITGLVAMNMTKTLCF